MDRLPDAALIALFDQYAEIQRKASKARKTNRKGGNPVVPHDLNAAVLEVMERTQAAGFGYGADAWIRSIPVPEKALSDMSRPELVRRYKPGNPFADKAAGYRFAYERSTAPTAYERASAESFPLGVGFSGKLADHKRLDATINRAVKSCELLRETESLEARAAAFDAGTCNAQGRRIVPDAVKAAVKEMDRKAAAVKKAAPILNDPAASYHITSQEWAAIPRDYKGVELRDGYRVRSAIHRMRLEDVYLTDKKTVLRAAVDNPSTPSAN